MTEICGFIYTALIGIAIAFQIALAAGAPWGKLAMGGKYPGRFPPAMRVATIVQMALLAAMATAVLSYSGILNLALPAWTYWSAIAVAVLSAVMNTITPSKPERLLWAPITIAMVISGLGAGLR